MLRTLSVLAAFAVALAGCSGDAPPADADPATPGVQDDAAAPFRVAAPPWQVGDWWEHHWVFASDGGPDFTVKSIVTGNESGTYTFGTDNVDSAAQHAAFFFMELGTMGPDGVMRSGDYAFPWYSFPLEDNKTWSAAEVNIGDGFEQVTRQLTLTARLMDSGSAPHFMVSGVVDGFTYVEYDYQPATGWFSEMRTYAPSGEGGAPELVYTITETGNGRGYTGPVFHATGEMLVNLQPLFHPGSSDLPTSSAQFTTGDATHVFALLFSFGAGGAHHTQMVAPNGTAWTATGAGDPDGGPLPLPPNVPSGVQVLTPALAGGWRVDLAGGGVVAGGGAFVWGATVTESTL